MQPVECSATVCMCVHTSMAFRDAVTAVPMLIVEWLPALLLPPGSACHAAEPGWFRVCYAWTPPDSLPAAVSRITAAVKQMGTPSLG
jgi:hypothetical protein